MYRCIHTIIIFALERRLGSTPGKLFGLPQIFLKRSQTGGVDSAADHVREKFFQRRHSAEELFQRRLQFRRVPAQLGSVDRSP